MIPIGESVTFDWKMVYNLYYQQPGIALFDTSQQYLSLNGNNLTITPDPTISSPLTQANISSCNPIYKGFIRGVGFTSNNITLVNGDEFTATIIYGINTETSGAIDLPCYTSASVGVNLRFENVVETCNCCELNNNEINVLETVQNYQP